MGTSKTDTKENIIVTSPFNPTQMISSKMIILLAILVICKGEIIRVGNTEIDLPKYTIPCQNHNECRDVDKATGEYCTLSRRCSRKKDGNTWCFEDAECASNSCYISSCTFVETRVDTLNDIDRIWPA